MIGSGLKKLAQELGMKVGKGVAYGSLRGYAAAFSEGAGYKQLVFTTKFPEPDQRAALLAAAQGVDLRKTYRVEQLEAMDDGILVVFRDDPGIMAKIRAFLNWFVPLLVQYGATPANVCTQCGAQIERGRWVLIGGGAFYLHDACLEKIGRDMEADLEAQRTADTGSYVSGTVGAFLGAALGAVAWAVVMYFGYVASLVGLLIGWLANLGYGLLHGKQGKGKLAALICAVIFGVAVGTFGGYILQLAKVLSEMSVTYSVGELPAMLMELFRVDGELSGALFKDLALGLVFAGIGVFAMLSRTKRELSAPKIQELE